MSRMLKALQRIEAKSARPQTAQSVPVSSADSSDAAAGDADMSTVDETFDRVESAVAMAAETLTDREQPPAAEPSSAEKRPPELAENLHRAYGELADRILAQLPADAPVALAVTSPEDRDGKTTLIRPLAEAIIDRAAIDVLVIDADLRHPGLTDRFAVRAVRGLADLLRGAADWEELVRPTSVPRLHLLSGVPFDATRGGPPEHVDLEPLLEEIGRHYPLVLIDTASMAHRETASIIGSCTGAYLVVQLNRTPRRTVDEAVRVIEQGNGRVLGVVVVGV